MKRESILGKKQARGRDNTDLADKLNKLFAVMHKASDPPLTNAAAAQGITGKTLVPIEAAELQELRAGKRTDPTPAQLRAIAEFFGVQPSYLINPGIDTDIDKQLNLLQTLRDTGVRNLSPHAANATPEGLRAVLESVIHHGDPCGGKDRCV